MEWGSGRWKAPVYTHGMNTIPHELRDKRTPTELDQSRAQSFWGLSVESGIQYYIAGRFAMFAHLTPTAGNQMHHAVEFLLKACLARQDPEDPAKSDTWQEILKYPRRYGHHLEKLWAEFKRRNPDPALAAHDDVIVGLNRFEDIRYPNDLIENGAMLTVSMVEVPPGERTRGLLMSPDRIFQLELPRIDRLVQLLFKASLYNPEFGGLGYLLRRAPAAEYLWLQNETPIVPRSASIVSNEPPPP